MLADQLGIPVPKDESTCTVLLLLRGEDGQFMQNEILENKGGPPPSFIDKWCRQGF